MRSTPAEVSTTPMPTERPASARSMTWRSPSGSSNVSTECVGSRPRPGRSSRRRHPEFVLIREPILYQSLHRYGGRFYPGTGSAGESGEGAGAGYTVNLPLERGTGPAQYLDLLDTVALPKIRRYRPELIFVQSAPTATVKIRWSGSDSKLSPTGRSPSGWPHWPVNCATAGWSRSPAGLPAGDCRLLLGSVPRHASRLLLRR